MKNIAIFASGSGTNAENLIRYFRTNPSGEVVLVLSNRADAGVISRSRNLDTDTFVFTKDQLYRTGEVQSILKSKNIDFIVLAGFLWLIPVDILTEYNRRIVNIHPALLPRYGGKGMYGHHVHEAVIASGDTESGITIHHVNQKYDEGNIIFQSRCKVEPGDTPDSLADKIHALEHEHFPPVVASLLQQF